MSWDGGHTARDREREARVLEAMGAEEVAHGGWETVGSQNAMTSDFLTAIFGRMDDYHALCIANYSVYAVIM
jgi:hypothetical protein